VLLAASYTGCGGSAAATAAAGAAAAAGPHIRKQRAPAGYLLCTVSAVSHS
jgi:hypothetical protein